MTLSLSRLAYGCMKLGGTWGPEPSTPTDAALARDLVAAALDAGLTFFDHADIYCRGKSETVFGGILRADTSLRDRIVLQSKVGIRFPGDHGEPARYDFSREHLLTATEACLRRLGTDRLDYLLLHRPDPLAEPAEIAAAFDTLHAAGKVLHFGVSNHTAAQIELLRRHVRQPIEVNQLEFSLAQPALVVEGFRTNQPAGVAESALAGGLLDYCRLHDILVQAWSPLGQGRPFAPEHGAAPVLNTLAARYDVSPEAIALAWILRHPAGIQPVVGTTRVDRLQAAAAATRITLTREEWYALLAAARGQKVP